MLASTRHNIIHKQTQKLVLTSNLVVKYLGDLQLS